MKVMILKDKDKEIIRYVEKYGFITIGQAYDIWFSHRRYGYDLSRKRLQQMVDDNYLKQQYDMEEMYAPKIFYIDDKYKKPSKHTILTMDVYAYLVRLGATVIYFKREEEWLDKKYRTDAFIIFTIEGYCYSAFIEVLKSTSSKDITQNSKFQNKYTELVDSKEAQLKIKQITQRDNEFDDAFLIIIDDIKHKYSFSIPNLDKIVVADYKLNGLSKALI
jgi:hypothetical protein